MLNIRTVRTENPQDKPAPGTPLGFGRIFTDHMFVMNYAEGKGWHDPRVVPFERLSLSPAAMVLHYGQAMFEGMKAYRAPDGTPRLFRAELNTRRAIDSCERLCIPPIPEEDYLQAVRAIVSADADWIPSEAGTSLYIRPFIIATEEFLGVHPSAEYKFIIILSPSGAYYANGMAPVGIWIEDEYVRAVRGGMGYIKAGGNYAVSLIGQVKAQAEGYAQVLWLDGVERRYIEEVGAMNIFFKISGRVYTPKLSGSILPGVTRDSVIQLLMDWDIDIEETTLSIDALIDDYNKGRVEEIFGTGTAAVISPVDRMRYKDDVLVIGDGTTGPLSQKLYDTLTGIQWGLLPDPHGWSQPV